MRPWIWRPGWPPPRRQAELISMILDGELDICWPQRPLKSGSSEISSFRWAACRSCSAISATSQLAGLDPGQASIGSAYSSPPFAALAYPIVKTSGRCPCCRVDVDRWAHLTPFVWRPLPVLFVDDVHIHRHLTCLILTKIDSAPTHHAPVVDAPPPAADVSRLKPHSSIRTRLRLIHLSLARASELYLASSRRTCDTRRLQRRYPTQRGIPTGSDEVRSDQSYMSMPPLTPHT